MIYGFIIISQHQDKIKNLIHFLTIMRITDYLNITISTIDII